MPIKLSVNCRRGILSAFLISLVQLKAKEIGYRGHSLTQQFQLFFWKFGNRFFLTSFERAMSSFLFSTTVIVFSSNCTRIDEGSHVFTEISARSRHEEKQFIQNGRTGFLARCVWLSSISTMRTTNLQRFSLAALSILFFFFFSLSISVGRV